MIIDLKQCREALEILKVAFRLTASCLLAQSLLIGPLVGSSRSDERQVMVVSSLQSEPFENIATSKITQQVILIELEHRHC